LSLPCQRFLDLRPQLHLGGLPSSKEKQGQFMGCIKDFYVDGQLIDFSQFEQMEKVGEFLRKILIKIYRTL
jgi:hypothetical protein